MDVVWACGVGNRLTSSIYTYVQLMVVIIFLNTYKIVYAAKDFQNIPGVGGSLWGVKITAGCISLSEVMTFFH